MDKDLMTQRLAFNTDKINHGDFIRVYTVNNTDKNPIKVPYRSGIVEEISFSSLKYKYFNEQAGALSTGYLLPGDIFIQRPTDTQWEENVPLYQFEIESAFNK